MRCPRCSCINSDDAQFCQNCGLALDAHVGTASQSAVPPTWQSMQQSAQGYEPGVAQQPAPLVPGQGVQGNPVISGDATAGGAATGVGEGATYALFAGVFGIFFAIMVPITLYCSLGTPVGWSSHTFWQVSALACTPVASVLVMSIGALVKKRNAVGVGGIVLTVFGFALVAWGVNTALPNLLHVISYGNLQLARDVFISAEGLVNSWLFIFGQALLTIAGLLTAISALSITRNQRRSMRIVIPALVSLSCFLRSPLLFTQGPAGFLQHGLGFFLFEIAFFFFLVSWLVLDSTPNVS